MRLFGTSGIRGVVGEELTPEFCRDVGQALGTTLPVGSQVGIATDTRLSREMVRDAVASGVVSTGVDVVHLGILPTPALAFLTREMGFACGVMITASHNPPEYNGIKVFNPDTIGYSLPQEDELEAVFRKRDFRTDAGRGAVDVDEAAKETYLERLLQEFTGFDPRLKVVVDPGNGAASRLAARLLSRLSPNVMPLNDDPDGTFPGRASEPTGETLRGTIDFLREKGADLAVCFDGDADRVVFCDREGFLGFTEMVAFVSRLAVQESGKRTVAATIEVGKLIDLALADLGGRVVRGKVGDVYLAHLTRDNDAAIGVEDIGVYILPRLGWYPESMGAALTLLSRISSPEEIRAFLRGFPKFYLGKEKVPCPNELKEPVMERIVENADSLGPAAVNTLDGIRLDFEESWMLIRASGTEPIIRVMTESVSEERSKHLAADGLRLVEQIVGRLGGGA